MTTTDRVQVGFRSERGPILAALMLCNSLVALDSTIIATSVLTIVDDLGGFSQFPWLFSVYLLAQAVTVPIYGKLADLFGRKRLVLFGIAVFAVGSVLCGLAWSMPALIVARAIQGIGAGAIQPMVQTIAGDIYTVRERAKAQGYLASVWAMSSIVGPTLGGLFSEYLSWRWIFFVNIPLCAVAAVMLMRKFDEKPTEARTRGGIDYTGAALLTVGAGAVILGLLEGGQSWAWNSPTSVAVFVLGAACLGVFVLVERRVETPILPLWVLTRRVLVATSAVGAVIGSIVLTLTTYVPTFVQGVLGFGALAGGFTLAPLLLSWPLMSSQSGRLYLRIGFRRTAVIGACIVVVGAVLTLGWTETSPIWQICLGALVIGAGMGLVASPALIAAQSSVDWSDRGVVTSTNTFARSIGSAVGIAVCGAIVNANVGAEPSPADLADAIHLVFYTVVAGAVLMLVAAFAMPPMSGQSPTRSSSASNSS
ncbi:disulfide bond formation protein DsbA [Rhodococcus sp. Leaf7]|uniref:MDR family MFS transporter n=1 Tax=unclassified Rhodococcus (in: high G+C Gram-positive bacteria) TaxID=192944 RepID=UPI0006F43642|nr:MULTISPECIES: MDR family MFS transporter [unclassified Rhodococcus (in: high G+C Gram-positive bacteria)]KQU07842.1 disulfide bond formation protein DsbA [Rhodococcus sp. Leaf7]KQU43360.1 disulfide bond formation protein DsbA [Rhodococcus sp. Leaf247]